MENDTNEPDWELTKEDAALIAESAYLLGYVTTDLLRRGVKLDSIQAHPIRDEANTMTHFEALERSRRALDSRPNCSLPLAELGPDRDLAQCVLWGCQLCGEYLSIDPLGVIREKGPIGMLTEGYRRLTTEKAAIKSPPQTRVQCARSPTGRHELAEDMLLGPRDDRRFPSGTEVYLRCRHCRASGRAVLEDNHIQWDDAEKVPD